MNFELVKHGTHHDEARDRRKQKHDLGEGPEQWRRHLAYGLRCHGLGLSLKLCSNGLPVLGALLGARVCDGQMLRSG